MDSPATRHLGLLGATGVGVGAIVGGGILALSGVAFATTGPSAIVAFALNGLIAGLTALSFAEMSAAFPESGGTYAYAKKVLSVEVAFMVGWVVWFASIVAAVLYALGFAAFAVTFLDAAASAFGWTAPWLKSRTLLLGLAVAATGIYTLGLVRKPAGGGEWVTIGKVVVLGAVVVAGGFALRHETPEQVEAHLSPFFSHGGMGLLRAMGYTFIALQGFDLIAAVGGEVRDPARNLPRSMLLSLGIALMIYLPLLYVTATVGVSPGQSIGVEAAKAPEAIIAIAAHRFLGPLGFWLVIVAAILAMLSALQANLYGASRIALTMARDRTLPHVLGNLSSRTGTPVPAILTTSAAVVGILFAIPDVAAAGAAASLIFLVSFAMAHWTSVLVRRRAGDRRSPFHLPWFPWIPAVGATACVGLAVFQGLAVSSAGILALVWLALGFAFYFTMLAPRSRIVDASALALDPELARLRGRSPLVLVPIANPASARSLVTIANALVVPRIGRVLLLSVVRPPRNWDADEAPLELRAAQEVLGESLVASFAGDLAPEALVTVSERPWEEIGRVSRIHRCESLLLGLGKLDGSVLGHPIEEVMSRVDSDVVILRATGGWRLSDARRVLVPVGGRDDQSKLRARLLGSLCRSGEREITFLRVVPQGSSPTLLRRARRDLLRLTRDEVPGPSEAVVVESDDVVAAIASRAQESGLVVLGLQRQSRRRKVLGSVPMRLARETDGPLILISRRG